VNGDRRPVRRQTALAALRWGMAAIVVAAVHFTAAWAALNWRKAEAAPDAPPPAVIIDLAPLAVAPPSPPQEVAPGPQMTEAQPVPAPDTPTPADETPDLTPPTPIATPEPPKPDPAPVEPAQTAEELKPDIPPPQPQEIKVPDLPKRDNAEATLAPRPKPKAHKEPPPKAHEAKRKKPIDLDKPKHRQTTAPPSSIAARSNTAAAPSAGSGASPSVSPATWKSELMAHLNRYKRYPSPRRQHRNRFSRLHHRPVGPSAVRSPDRFIGQSGAGRRGDLAAASREPRSGPAAGFWRRRSNPHRAYPFRRLRRVC
jgi:periplasmic protein TonB